MEPGAKVRIGIVGAGGIAESIHLPCLMEIEEAEVVSVCDIDIAKARHLAARYGIPHVTAVHTDMPVDRMDAVFVLVQPDQAFRIVLDLLDRGLDVFVEKPAGVDSYQAETLLRKSLAVGRIVQVGLNRRYIPLVARVLETMRRTTPITQVEGTFFKNGDAAFYDGCSSAFMSDTIHAIDLVRYAAGSDAIPVKAATIVGRVDSPVDNQWNSLFVFDNGVTGIVKANYETGGRVHRFEIHGPLASAYVDLGFGGNACEARILRFNGKRSYSAASVGTGEPDILVLDGIAVAGHAEYHGYYGYLAEDRAFLDSVRTRRPPLVDIREAAVSMRMAEMLERSTF